MKNTVKVERAKVNMTQSELASKVSVSRQTINAIETKRYSPSAVLAMKIARVFDIQVEDLFELEAGD